MRQSVHPRLQKALDNNNFKYVTPIQQKVIEAGALNGESMVILGESGGGKTLAYLLPVINSLQHHKDEVQQSVSGSVDFDYSSTSEVEDIEKINQGYFRFSKASESEMFQNANELYYD